MVEKGPRDVFLSEVFPARLCFNCIARLEGFCWVNGRFCLSRKANSPLVHIVLALAAPLVRLGWVPLALKFICL